MSTWVIGVAGGIAAGKTTFISALAAATAAHVTGFGAYIRELAVEQGADASSRDVLQALGERVKDELGTEEFVRRVMSRVPTDGFVIVDGVRHVEVADALELISTPRTFILVFLDVDEATRQVRAATRLEDASRLQELAAHSTERQVRDGSLRGRAHLVLDARQDVRHLVADTLRHLAAR